MPPRLKAKKPRLKFSGTRLKARPPRDEAERSRQRYTDNPWRAWYATSRWKRLRLKVADRDQWTCQRTGVLLSGTHPAPNSLAVHHRKPHRGDKAKFYDIDNCEAVSKQWHDSQGQREDNQ